MGDVATCIFGGEEKVEIILEIEQKVDLIRRFRKLRSDLRCSLMPPLLEECSHLLWLYSRVGDGVGGGVDVWRRCVRSRGGDRYH